MAIGSGVVISDTVPANTSFVSATGGGTLAAGVVTWNIGNLAAGASADGERVVEGKRADLGGRRIIKKKYSIGCNETAATAGATITTTVASSPVLIIGKTDAPDPVVQGTTIAYAQC